MKAAAALDTIPQPAVMPTSPPKIPEKVKCFYNLLDWVEFGQSCQIKKPVKPLLPFCIRIRKMPLV